MRKRIILRWRSNGHLVYGHLDKKLFRKVVQIQFQLVQGNERIGGKKVESLPVDNSFECRERKQRHSVLVGRG